MTWQNIFELGACDVYVRFLSEADQGNPAWDVLVPIADFPATMGTVVVVGNQVVCNFTTPGGGGGAQPQVVVVPLFDVSAATAARASEVSASGTAIPTTYEFSRGAFDGVNYTADASAPMTGPEGSSTATLTPGPAAGQSLSVFLDAPAV